jgi:hypothetical protein
MPQDERHVPTHTHLATALRSSRDGWEDEAEAGKRSHYPFYQTGETIRLLKSVEDAQTFGGFARLHGITIGEITLLTGNHRRWLTGLRRRGMPLFVAEFERTHTTRPLVVDILASLASDATAVETSISADDWALNTGIPYEKNLRHKYLTARRQTRRLRAWLPVGAYETLLWNITQ